MVSNWIDWNGGDCPVPKGMLVDVKLRNGTEFYNQHVVNDGSSWASSGYWRHDGVPYDIIAWRMDQPERPAWNGEGMPPEGIECEFAFIGEYRESFCRGKVIAYGESNVFMQHWASKNEFIQPQSKIKFRPIRTEAERKRDEFTDACIELDSSQDWSHSTDYFRGLYNAIAAGKIPGVKLED